MTYERVFEWHFFFVFYFQRCHSLWMSVCVSVCGWWPCTESQFWLYFGWRLSHVVGMYTQKIVEHRNVQWISLMPWLIIDRHRVWHVEKERLPMNSSSMMSKQSNNKIETYKFTHWHTENSNNSWWMLSIELILKSWPRVSSTKTLIFLLLLSFLDVSMPSIAFHFFCYRSLQGA